jgi:guanine nucleotide-binding protein G(i) subunit alpha
MKLLYASGFSTAERKGYRRIVFSNILDSLRVVLEAMVFYGLAFETEANKVLSFLTIPRLLGVHR